MLRLANLLSAMVLIADCAAGAALILFLTAVLADVGFARAIDRSECPRGHDPTNPPDRCAHSEGWGREAGKVEGGGPGYKLE